MIRRRTGSAGAFSFSSARGALSAVLTAGGVGPGDEVLLSSYTCLAVPTGVLGAGATPTYCDVDPTTLNVTRQSVEASVTARTRAIVVQHTLGSVAPVDEIIALAREKAILVIEDCALAIGSSADGAPVGALGDAAIYSMELSKTMSVGWGGILTVNEPQLAERMTERYADIDELPTRRALQMALQTVVCGFCYLPALFWLGKYVVYYGFKHAVFRPSTPDAEFNGLIATNFVAKLPGPQAALARHQWMRFDTIADACAANGRRIRKCLRRLGYEPLGRAEDGAVIVAPRVSLLVADRSQIIARFQRDGVDLGSWFDGPMSPLPKTGAFNYDRNQFPNATFLASHIINIPCHSRLSESDLERIEQIMESYAETSGFADAALQRQLPQEATR
jgi:dTDP-4-amino-4,6-dideoxygalactose transaminase